jgi:hypothetical protein
VLFLSLPVVDDEDDDADGLQSSESEAADDDDDDYKDDGSIASSSSSEAEWADTDDDDDDDLEDEEEEDEDDDDGEGKRKRKRLVKNKAAAGRAPKRATKQMHTPGSVQKTPKPAPIREPNATPVSSLAAPRSGPSPNQLFTPGSGKKLAPKPSMSPMTPVDLNEGNGVLAFGRHDHHR